MEGFVGEEEDFVLDVELAGKPVKVDEGVADALPELSLGENPGRRVLHIPQVLAE